MRCGSDDVRLTANIPISRGTGGTFELLMSESDIICC